MKFILDFTHTAKKVLKNLKENSGKKKQYKAVIKTFIFLTQSHKHPVYCPMYLPVCSEITF